MNYREYFSNHSALYASARPSYPEELFRFIASLAPTHERAWDCATGNGQAAVGLARYFAAVDATDASEDQIAHAWPCAGVTYSVRSAEESGFPSHTFDAVCVASAIHWFVLQRFYPEVERVLKEGGAFVAWGYDHLRVWPEFDEVFEQLVERVIASYWPPRKRLLHDGYRDIPFPFTKVEAPPLKMEMEWGFDRLIAFVRSWSGAQRCIAANGAAFFATATRELARLWGDPEKVRLCTMDLFILAGRQQR